MPVYAVMQCEALPGWKARFRISDPNLKNSSEGCGGEYDDLTDDKNLETMS